MADPLNVWVASLKGEPLYIDAYTEKDMWVELIEKVNLPRTVLESLGWTVRPMRLLDGHGEQEVE